MSFHGLKRTRMDLLVNELAFMTEAETLAELGYALTLAEENLRSLGIFRACTLTLDAIPEARVTESRIPVALQVDVREARPLQYSFHVSTSPHTRKITLEGLLRLVNLFGRAEALKVSVSQDATRGVGQGVHAEYSAPRFWGRDLLLRSGVDLTRASYRDEASYVLMRGGIWSALPVGPGTLKAEASLLNLADPTRTASRHVVKQLGDHTKVGVSYVWSAIWGADSDENDDEEEGTTTTGPGPTLGLRSLSEVAGPPGLGGAMQFVKQTVEASLRIPVRWWLGSEVRGSRERESRLDATTTTSPPSSSSSSSTPSGVAWRLSRFTVAAKAGALVPTFSAWGRPTPITERLYLGGTGTLRGFIPRRAGPAERRRDQTDDEVTTSSTSTTTAATSSWRRWLGLGGDEPERTPTGRRSGYTHDALGGDVAWCAHVGWSAPFWVEGGGVTPVGLHVFADAGSAALWSRGRETGVWSRLQSGLTAQTRVAAGIGLVIPTGKLGSMEINVTRKIRRVVGDRGGDWTVTAGFSSGLDGFA